MSRVERDDNRLPKTYAVREEFSLFLILTTINESTALSLKPLSNVTTPWENRRGGEVSQCLQKAPTWPFYLPY